MARVVLTGATGVLGRHVRKALTAMGHEVIGLSRRPPAGPGWARADLRTGEGVAEAARGAESVVHCATDPLQASATDLAGVRWLRETAPEARLVYPSIVGIDEVDYPYYREKRRVEDEVASGPHAILRLTQFHEFPHQLAALPVVAVPLDFRTQPIAAREAAHLLAACVEGPSGRRPDAGGPEVHDLRTLVERVVVALGRATPVLAVPTPGREGFRRGRNLCPDRKVGRQTWEEHFQEWLAARPAAG